MSAVCIIIIAYTIIYGTTIMNIVIDYTNAIMSIVEEGHLLEFFCCCCYGDRMSNHNTLLPSKLQTRKVITSDKPWALSALDHK